jgi:uncharacterized membrane protein YfcA
MLWGFLRKRGNTALFRCRSGSLFFIIAGLVTLEIIIEALILMPAIFLGTWMGARFFHTATPERFWAALHGLLVCGGLVLVGKGFAKMR